jgi:two-component system phosphate regulon response regulator PhoB
MRPGLQAPGARLLIIEDDPGILELIAWHFERENCEVQCTSDGEEGLLLARETRPDLVLLDWMLPGQSGIDICTRLRAHPGTRTIPVIMLTARTDERDRIRGFEAGVDDYVTKPFSPRELIARCKAVLRRASPNLGGASLAYADLSMDVDNYRVKRNGKTLSLGPKEFHLLRHFMENPGRVLSRERLLSAVWGNDVEIGVRTVDVHIRRLRLTLNQDGGRDLIRTVRSGGYALDVEA